jgi:4-diphosphocytidyl-2-C-methyl-D-erythritol kinase
LPAGRPLHFVIVQPPVGLATRDVFRAHDEIGCAIDSGSRQVSKLEASLKSGGWSALSGAMFNRLEEAAKSISPWIAKIRGTFNRLDCVAHQLTGSGSAYFGVCRHAQQARRLASILKARQLGLVYATCSCQ